VLDGDPAPPPQIGAALSPIFGPCLSWPNGQMNQDGTWHGGGPWSRPHCARWGPSSTHQKGGTGHKFLGPFLLWPNGWMHQEMPLGMEISLSPGDFVLDVDPSPSPKRSGAPNFRPTSIVAKRMHVSRCHLVRRYIGLRLRERDIVLDGDPSPLPLKGAQPPNFRPMSVVSKRADGLRCHLVWR